MCKVERVAAEIVRPLRHKVLRPNLPISSSVMPLDNHDASLHFCVNNGNRILSVASFYKEPFDELSNKESYRLRGMATEPKEQGNGYGSQVLKAALIYLKQKTNTEILWCNARTTAFGFYEKMGFSIVGDEFDIPNIGPHKKGFIYL
jgi:predicted GNAT family N-acyltransferase